MTFRSSVRCPLPLIYKSTKILRAYKPDLLVENAVIVELKTIDKILQIHEAQLLTYLRLSGLERGLLDQFQFCATYAWNPSFEQINSLTDLTALPFVPAA